MQKHERGDRGRERLRIRSTKRHLRSISQKADEKWEPDSGHGKKVEGEAEGKSEKGKGGQARHRAWRKKP